MVNTKPHNCCIYHSYTKCLRSVDAALLQLFGAGASVAPRSSWRMSQNGEAGSIQCVYIYINIYIYLFRYKRYSYMLFLIIQHRSMDLDLTAGGSSTSLSFSRSQLLKVRTASNGRKVPTSTILHCRWP